jgi:uncharacterized membrane protein
MSFIDPLLFPLTFLAAIGCGLIGGIFFAFSNFVMKALARIPDEHGIRAMQAINVTVLNPLFLTIFLGTAVICALLGIISLVRWQGSGARCLLAGAILYVLGNFVVTLARNVPRNDALARENAADPNVVDAWHKYVIEWTKWNHVRTVTALGAAALFTVAVCQLRNAS